MVIDEKNNRIAINFAGEHLRMTNNDSILTDQSEFVRKTNKSPGIRREEATAEKFGRKECSPIEIFITPSKVGPPK